MLLADLDFLAINRKNLLSSLAIRYKIVFLIMILVLALTINNLWPILLSYLILILLLFISRLPIRKTLLPSLFPLIFLFAFFLSFNNFSFYFFLLYTFKALNLSLLLILILATTPIFRLLKFLGKFLSPFLITAIWLTYKSFFILEKNFESLLSLWHLRGGISLKFPMRTLKNIAYGLGLLIIKSLDNAEREYLGLSIRGYNGKIF